MKPIHVLTCLPCLLLWMFSSTVLAGDKDWKPVTAQELSLKAPAVEKDADAEALFWEVRVEDSESGGSIRTVLNHYIRIKVFTERGKETQSTIDLSYPGNYKIEDIAARTIKPGGSIVELKKDAVFDKTLVKVSGVKLKAKSFALPGVEPGCIIEYRWREVRPDHLSQYMRLKFQRDIPVQRVTYFIKPLQDPSFPYLMRYKMFHGQHTPFEPEKNGFYGTTSRNVPALREEPDMPPEDELQAWMLIYYEEEKKLTPQEFWQDFGKNVYETSKSEMKVNDDIRKATAAAVGAETDPMKKLEKIFEFCRTKIKNSNSDASGMTSEERKKLKENKNSTDTLKRGYGTGWDIDMLFGAMAIAAGFESRMALLSSRNDVFFDKSFPSRYFLKTYNVAVRVGQKWHFFDPAGTYMPFGMLLWQEEGQDALVGDSKVSFFAPTPISPPEKSLVKRTANLKLTEDGTLDGEVRIEYTGHLAAEHRFDLDDQSPAEREKDVFDMVKNRLNAAELADIKVENLTDVSKPFTQAFRVRVPGFAQRTGKRLFIQPSFFQIGVQPRFTTADRRHPVYFHFPWTEEDNVLIELPAGYALDSADAPGNITVPKVGGYEVSVKSDGKILYYQRKFRFGENGSILFPSSAYPQIKQLFEQFHQRDNHTITLKQGATAANQ